MPKPDLGAQYRHAKASVAAHLQAQGAIELERFAWLKAHRGVPADAIYDRDTGEPLDPELADLEARIRSAETDVAWCRSLVLACGEAFKGEPLSKILAREGTDSGRRVSEALDVLGKK